MKPEILPILKSYVEWTTLQKAFSELFGREITRCADRAGIPLQDAAGFLAAIQEFVKEGATYDVKDTKGLKHITYGFLIVADSETLLQLSTETDVIVTHSVWRNGDYAVIATGTMFEWNRALIHGATQRSPFNYRLLCDKLILYFEKEGFHFPDYTRKALPDQSFILVPKR